MPKRIPHNKNLVYQLMLCVYIPQTQSPLQILHFAFVTKSTIWSTNVLDMMKLACFKLGMQQHFEQSGLSDFDFNVYF